MLTDTEGDENPMPPVFTPRDLQEFLDELFCCYISSFGYDSWTGSIRAKHYLMIRHLHTEITN